MIPDPKNTHLHQLDDGAVCHSSDCVDFLSVDTLYGHIRMQSGCKGTGIIHTGSWSAEGRLLMMKEAKLFFKGAWNDVLRSMAGAFVLVFMMKSRSSDKSCPSLPSAHP